MKLVEGQYRCQPCLDMEYLWYCLNDYFTHIGAGGRIALFYDLSSVRYSHAGDALWVLAIDLKTFDRQFIYFGQMLSSNYKAEIGQAMEKIISVADEHQVSVVSKVSDHSSTNDGILHGSCVMVSCSKILQAFSKGEQVVIGGVTYKLTAGSLNKLHRSRKTLITGGFSDKNPKHLMNSYSYLLIDAIFICDGIERRLNSQDVIYSALGLCRDLIQLFDSEEIVNTIDNQNIQRIFAIALEHSDSDWGKMLIRSFRGFVEGTINVGLPKFVHCIWLLEEGIKSFSTGDFYIDVKKAKLTNRYLSTDLGLEAVIVDRICADCPLKFTETAKYKAHRRCCVMRRVGHFKIIIKFTIFIC